MANRTVNEILQLSDSIKPSSDDIKLKIQWINDVDGAIWTQLFKYTKGCEIHLTANTATYVLPQDVNFNRIVAAYMNDEEVPKLSASQHMTTGVSRGTDNTINVYPTPLEDGVLKLAYYEEFKPHTETGVLSEKVLAEQPFDKLYLFYISAMVDFTRNEFNTYNNSRIMFNAAFNEFAEWLVRTHAIERSEFSCNSLLQDIQTKSTMNTQT